MKRFTNFLKEVAYSFKDNVLLLGLLLTAVLNDFTLRAMTVKNLLNLKPVFTSLAIALLVSVIILIFNNNKKRDYLYIVFSGIFAGINIANYMYYKHFSTFLSVGVLNQTKHLGSMGSSIVETMDIRLLLFILPTSVFIYYYKKVYQNKEETEKLKYPAEVRVLGPLIMGVALLFTISTTLTGSDYSRLSKQWNRHYLVEQFGIYTFTIADVAKNSTAQSFIKADYGDHEDEMNALVNENKKNNVDNKYTNVLEGKDIYVIHYESVQNFAMDLEFEDGPVTPFLNKLSNESIFFENFYPQHSVGTSSDTEFTFNTSLFPINNQTVFIDHFDKEFVTLQNQLNDKGYHTMSLHGNDGTFWNRNLMHPNLGYNEFLSKENFEIDEVLGLGLSDKSFYTQTVEKIKSRKVNLDKPIMAKLITLTNHYPFDALDAYGEFDTGYLEGTGISNYLKSMNYADRALEQFFNEMDAQGLLDNAAVIIYGDHHASIKKEDYELLYNYDSELEAKADSKSEGYISIDNAYLRQVRKTPMLIWSKDLNFSEVVSQPVGMIDALPILANMTNIENNFSLGKDIFNSDDNFVIYPDGSFVTKDIYYSAAKSEVYSMETNELLMGPEDLDQEVLDIIEYAEMRIKLSTDIIQNDLIQYHNTLNK